MANDEGEVRLLQRVAEGDRQAFRELYHRYHRRLFSYVFKVVRRPPLVEEVVDDTLLAVWRGAGRFAGRSRPSTWILGIAYRQAMKALRRERRAESMESEVPAAAGDGPEETAARRELASAISDALAEISPEQRAVVVLTHYGYSYSEIATIVDCPVNTVKTRMFHARRRLQEALTRRGIDGGTGG